MSARAAVIRLSTVKETARASVVYRVPARPVGASWGVSVARAVFRDSGRARPNAKLELSTWKPESAALSLAWATVRNELFQVGGAFLYRGCVPVGDPKPEVDLYDDKPARSNWSDDLVRPGATALTRSERRNVPVNLIRTALRSGASPRDQRGEGTSGTCPFCPCARNPRVRCSSARIGRHTD